MTKYRKKPVVIEAVQWDGTEDGWRHDVSLLARGTGMQVLFCEGPGNLIELEIETLEGTMTASKGDWIIKGVKDELYPCKPDIFEATYEKA